MADFKSIEVELKKRGMSLDTSILFKAKHAMLDLETLDILPTAVIIQAALVPFDIETGIADKNRFEVNIDRISCEGYGLTVGDETLAWWQQGANRSAWETTQVDPVSLPVALQELGSFVSNYLRPDCRIWCHATFDIPVIEHAYSVVPGCIYPWTYKQGRDIRTLEELYRNFVSNTMPSASKVTNGVRHNALSDCLYQIEYVSHMYNTLKNKIHG